MILILTALGAPIHVFGAVLPPGQGVTLAWDKSTDLLVAGYHVYYGGASRTYTNMVNAGNATNVTILGMLEGANYFFAATAYNLLGLESAFSEEISYTVPVVPVTLQIRVATNQQAILTVTGAVGRTYNIQASSDFKTWSVIGSVMLPAGGSLDFTDTNAPSFPKRFYRTQ